MSDNLKNKLLAKDKWLRFLFMVLFSMITCVAWWIYQIIVFFQFISILFTDKVNNSVSDFSQQLNTYIHQILCYLTYNTEMKPFPFNAWPKEIKAIQMENK